MSEMKIWRAVDDGRLYMSVDKPIRKVIHETHESYFLIECDDVTDIFMELLNDHKPKEAK